jgi:predicted DNA helicase
VLKQLGKTLKQREKEAIHDALTSAQVVLCTNTGAGDPLILKLEAFDLVVVDEAAQAIEPSCWIPLLQGRRCVLAGDACQLAPTIMSRQALDGGLGVSLMERAGALHGGLLSTMLGIQYRMHHAIALWASHEMYGGRLRSAPHVASHLLRDSLGVQDSPLTRVPMLLLDTRLPFGSLIPGCDERLDPAGTGSFYNEGEADIVVAHIRALLATGVPPASIAVQSPYMAQVQLLCDRIEEIPGAEGVQVASVDSFQGREADAVVISMVRSNNIGVVGFLGDNRRMNVAVTRARKHVTIVCDSTTVSRNEYLQRLLQHIRRFGEVRCARPTETPSRTKKSSSLPSRTT